MTNDQKINMTITINSQVLEYEILKKEELSVKTFYTVCKNRQNQNKPTYLQICRVGLSMVTFLFYENE